MIERLKIFDAKRRGKGGALCPERERLGQCSDSLQASNDWLLASNSESTKSITSWGVTRHDIEECFG